MGDLFEAIALAQEACGKRVGLQELIMVKVESIREGQESASPEDGPSADQM